MGVGEFRGGKGGGVKWTEHLFLMLCTFKDNTTYLIQFQINYITCTQLIMSLNRFVKDLRKPPLPPLPVHYHMSVTTSPSPHLLLLQTRWHTHYTLYLHRYTPLSTFPCPASTHWCWGIPQSCGIPPHIHTGPILPGAISVFSQHWRLLPMHCEPRWIKKVLPCWNLAACNETYWFRMLIQTICLSMMSTWFRY